MEWKIVNVKLKDLKKHPKNPRTLSKIQFDHLKESLDRFGLVEKLIVNTDMMIIGGHQRYEVLKKSKVKEVDCWIPDVTLSEKEVEELLLRLNRNHGDFNYDELANNFEVPDLLDYGFSIEELELKEIDDIGSEEEKPKKEKRCPHCDGVL
jgi:ParB-like chromosome segregation protein Spo0J